MTAALPAGLIVARDFRVVRPLSSGGMGSVYVVDQLSTGSQRALKVMHPLLATNPKLRERFEQEARTGARIESEHVVQVISAGVDDATRTPFLVMELLTGEELGAHVARCGPLSLDVLRKVMGELCHALEAAHRQGIIHRDIKPENIFLAESKRRGETFFVKLLDFGIAKVIADARTSSTAAIGTPFWMAPEQTESGGTVTPRTDVWALGLLGFWMLTGKEFWRSANIADASAITALREIALDPLPTPEARALELGAPNAIPPGFREWFERCVNRDASARYADAGEASRAFDSLVADPASQRRPPVQAPRTQIGLSTALGHAPTVLQAPFTPRGATQLAGGASIPPAPARQRTQAPRWPLVAAAALGLALLGGAFGAYRTWGDRSVAAPVGSASADAGATPTPSSQPSRDGLTFVAVPAGSFEMSTTEITQAQFAAYVAATKAEPKGACWTRSRATGEPSPTADWKFPQEGVDHPVVCVTQAEAKAYAAWISKETASTVRLPTSAEWELAARAGNTSNTFAWGSEWPPPRGAANIADKSALRLGYSGKEARPLEDYNDGWTYSAPVGKTTANALGLFDMTGNVYEWVGDECAVRGGSWDSGSQEVLKVTAKLSAQCDGRFSATGFRVVRELAAGSGGAPAMVSVPPGAFLMGTRPTRTVTMTKGFSIATTEVTVAAYQRCVEAGACTPSGIHRPGISDAEVKQYTPMCNAVSPERAQHPINCIDRSQAEAYCKFVKQRLPTEAEWEYAARGTDGRAYPWGDEAPACERGAIGPCRAKTRTAEVGAFPAGKSPFGALDMAGNVWEWVADDWDEDAGALGVLRGGSWDFAANHATTFFRLRFRPDEGHVSTGVRCATSASP